MTMTQINQLKRFKKGEFPVDPYTCFLAFDFGNSSTKVILVKILESGEILYRLVLVDGCETCPSKAVVGPDNDLVFGLEAVNYILTEIVASYSVGKDQLDQPNQPSISTIVDAKDAKDAKIFRSHDVYRKYIAFIFDKVSQSIDYLAYLLPLFVSCPANFSSRQKGIFLDTLKKCGCENILGLENEPTQAFKKIITQENIHGNILIYDMGGGTTDVTLGYYDPVKNEFSILESQACSIAGHDFTHIITNEVIQRLFQGESIDPCVNTKIFYEAEAAKEFLSENINAPMLLPYGKDIIPFEFSRDLFESLSAEKQSKILSEIDRVINAGKLNHSQIDFVVITGGATLTPFVRREITQHLPNARPIYSHAPLFDVVQGNAISGVHVLQQEKQLILSGMYLSPPKVRNILNHDISIVVTNSSEEYKRRNFLLIPQKKELPAQASISRFCPLYEGQTEAHIQITKGLPNSEYDPKDLIGEAVIPLTPGNLKRKEQVEIIPSIDESNVVTIIARDFLSPNPEDHEIVIKLDYLLEETAD